MRRRRRFRAVKCLGLSLVEASDPRYRRNARLSCGLWREMWVVQAGTAVSHRVRRDGGAANSVNIVRYQQDAFTVQR